MVDVATANGLSLEAASTDHLQRLAFELVLVSPNSCHLCVVIKAGFGNARISRAGARSLHHILGTSGLSALLAPTFCDAWRLGVNAPVLNTPASLRMTGCPWLKCSAYKTIFGPARTWVCQTKPKILVGESGTLFCAERLVIIEPKSSARRPHRSQATYDDHHVQMNASQRPCARPKKKNPLDRDMSPVSRFACGG